jgi:hypothetical protein
MNKRKIFLSALIAALMFTSAASFATAQKKNKKKNTDSSKTTTEKTATPIAAATPEPVEPQPEKKNNRDNNSASVDKKTDENALTYSYEFTQPAFVTSRVFIEHDANGKGKITWERKSAGEPITDPIEISPEVWARIKSLWTGLNFLDSTANYQTDKSYAHLGTMRLSMKQGTRERTAEFNWTNDKKASELVNEYRRIGDQAMFIFDINLARDISPLETPKMMDYLADMLKRNIISDPKQLLPLLSDISVDERLPLIARNHASRLVKQIEKIK